MKQNKTKHKYDFYINRYGLLADGTKVLINYWSSGDEPREVYFKYIGIEALFKKQKTAWAYETDFVAFVPTKKELRKTMKKLKRRNE